MAAFVMLGIYGYVTVKNGKIKQSTGFRSLITLFLKVSFVLNLFVFNFHHQHHGAAVLYYDF